MGMAAGDEIAAFLKGQKSGSARAANKKPKRKRGKRAKSIGILSTLAAIAALGEIGGDALSILLSKQKQTLGARFRASGRALVEDMTLARSVKAFAPLGATLGGQMMLGRRNPGLTIGKFRIKLV